MSNNGQTLLVLLAAGALGYALWKQVKKTQDMVASPTSSGVAGGGGDIYTSILGAVQAVGGAVQSIAQTAPRTN